LGKQSEILIVKASSRVLFLMHILSFVKSIIAIYSKTVKAFSNEKLFHNFEFVFCHKKENVLTINQLKNG